MCWGKGGGKYCTKSRNAGYKHFPFLHNVFKRLSQAFYKPGLCGNPPGRLSDEHVRPGGCELDPWSRQLFFLAYLCLSPLQKHVRKVVSGFGKKSCVNTGVRKPGNTCASPTAI